MEPITSDIVAVDLFCGASGLSLGLMQSGIKIAAGIDVDPACRYPFEQNIGAPFILRDVVTLNPCEVSALFNSAKIKLLAGCAPCQPFSGYTTRRRDVDDRWRLLIEFLRIARITMPDVITLENVPRLIHLPLWKTFVDGLREVGFQVSWQIVDAADYGVPQRRKRVVLLASLLGNISFPIPPRGAIPTVRKAIGSLPEIGAGDQSKSDPLHASRALTERNLARIKISKQAGTWKDWPEDMRANCHKKSMGKTYPSVYGRMSWDQPSPTITTQFYGFGNGRFGHPDQDRAITLREGAILQSFPLEFKFCPPEERINFRQIGRLIGNAVPPLLARAIGQCIVDHASSV